MVAKKHLDWDVFISHATEDKESLVKPLAEALASFGLRVWYDEFSLKPGDSLSRSIDKGLAQSSYGVVVLSSAFFSKHWSEYELRGLTAREVSGSKVIIPLWHHVDRDQVLRFSPPLADKLAIKTVGKTPTQIAIAIIEVTNPDLFEKVHRRIKFLHLRAQAKVITVDPKGIRPGPIRHQELSDDLVSRIRLVRAALLGIDTHSMKHWLEGFQRDAHPSREVAVWERMCAALMEYMSMTPINRRQLKHLYRVVLGVANGNGRSVLLKDLQALPQDAFKVISLLMSNKVPAYDIKEQSEFEDLDEVHRINASEDRELFPVDIPDRLLKEIMHPDDADKKKKSD